MSTKKLNQPDDPNEKKTCTNGSEKEAVCSGILEKPPVFQEIDPQKRKAPDQGMVTKSPFQIQPQQGKQRPGHSAARAGDPEEIPEQAGDLQQIEHSQQGSIGRQGQKLSFFMGDMHGSGLLPVMGQAQYITGGGVLQSAPGGSCQQLR